VAKMKSRLQDLQARILELDPEGLVP
jgi:hypothetical protein